jgi:phosphate transporter
MMKKLISFYKKYRKFVSILVASIAFASILIVRPFGHQTLTGNETFAILMFSIILWGSNPLPIYVIALMAPVMAVWLQVLVKEGARGSEMVRMERKDAGEYVLKFMINRIVTVALGGFVLARALNKSLSGTSHVANFFMKHISQGKSFCWLLLGLILTPMYLAALIPHEAAVLIIFDLIAPVIYLLPVDSHVAKVSLLAIMLGGNLGGMLSSISTPQNILLFSSSDENSAGDFQLTFFSWARVSIPVTFVSAIGVWIGLLLIWKPWRLQLSPAMTPALDEENRVDVMETKEIDSGAPIKLDLKNAVQNSPQPKLLTPLLKYYTFIVALLTIFLWLSARRLQNTFGGLGIVSLVPIIALFGAGVLDKDDLHALPWDVVLLAMGATTLSSICKNSGLFELIEKEFEVLLGPLSGWPRIALLCVVMAFSSAVKSRYISALVYLPLAFRAIGSTSSAEAPGFIVGQKILVAFACSAGMLLPISGLINAFIIQIGPPQSTNKKEKYIGTMELTVAGALGTFVSLASIISIGYLSIKYI